MWLCPSVLIITYVFQVVISAPVSPLGTDCFTNQYEKLNDPSIVQVPYDISTSPKYPDKALNFENPITFLELARVEVTKAWNNFLNSICQTEPKVGMEWAGQCRVFVSKLRDKLCYFSALYPGQGGQYSFDPWEVVQEEVAHQGYYLTGQYLDMFGIGGNDVQKAEQFVRIQNWYYAQRSKIGKRGEVVVYGAKYGPTFDQYVKLKGPMMKDGSEPSEASPYQVRNVLEQFWGVNGKVALKEYGAWENLGYLFRIVHESALGKDGARWDFLLAQNDLTATEGTANPPVYKVHDEFHELRKQVRAMWINLREYPEIMPSAWASLTIPGAGGGFALWDTATMSTKQVDGHSMIKALFDNDQKHRDYYRSWGWSEELIWLAEALALGGYYHIDLENPYGPQALETQAMWDFVERFGYINDQMMDYRFGVAAGKDATWIANQKADINNKWMYLKRWLIKNDLKSLLTGIVKMLPATSCSSSKQPTPSTLTPTNSPTSAAPTTLNSTLFPSLAPSFAPSTLPPSTFSPSPAEVPTPSEAPGINPIPSLDFVPSSASRSIPLPSLSNETSFLSKKALMIVSHGSNDYQTIYVYQYLTERGAMVEFVCPMLLSGQTHAVLMDGVLPKYLVTCTSLVNATLLPFDVVVVLGGSAATSDLRLQSPFTKQLLEYWRTPGKVLACIGTGSEVLIEAGIATELHSLVIHPSSMWSFRKALQYAEKLSSSADHFNRTAGSVSQTLINRATLLLCQDTPFLNETVIHLGAAFGLREQVDQNQLRFINFTHETVSSSFTSVKVMSDLPIVRSEAANETVPCDGLNGKSVGIIVASGADAMQVAYIYNHSSSCNATIFIICPEETFMYDEGWAYLLFSPPVRPDSRLKCSMDLETLSLEHYQKGGKPELDVLIIPGGPISTDMVLRSDSLLSELVGKHIGAGRVLGLLGTGASVLLSTDLVPKSKLAASKYLHTDLFHSGYVLPPGFQSVVYKQVVGAADPDNPHHSGLGFLVMASGDSPADLPSFAKSLSSALHGEGRLPQAPEQPISDNGKDDGGTSVEAILLPILVLALLIAGGVLWFLKHSRRSKPQHLQLQQNGDVLDITHPQDYAQLR